jgi:hypothetical protein
MRSTLSQAMLQIALACLSAPAWAGVPAASTSTVPGRLFLCPAGDSVFTVLPRHVSLNPWGEGEVWVSLCDCPAVKLSRVGAVGYTVDAAGCVVTDPPMPDGVYRFPVAGGGLCPGAWAITWAGGVLLANHTVVVSPDQDGNLVVDDRDVAAVRAKLGTADPGADLDGDGTVTQADVDLVVAHLGHAGADRPVSAQPATWGRLKLIYR